MRPEIERRSLRGVELRVADEGGMIVGYAAVFNSLSEDLGGFREVIVPGAFDRAISEAHDVRALVNHDSSQLLGRTKSGTLKLSVDEKGLRAEIDPPATQAAIDALASISRGDMDGMSFAFRTLSDDWRAEGDQLIRELRDLELLDVSVVTFPAYPETQVAARALEMVRAQGVPNEVNQARVKLAGL